MCGTPDYIAPEVCALLDLKKVPKEKRPCYGTGCDIWSAGVIIYILLGGYPPFFDDNRNRLFKKIKSGVFEFHDQYWGATSVDAKDLISKMMEVDYTKRLSASQCLEHAWIKKKVKTSFDQELSLGALDNLRNFTVSILRYVSPVF